MIRCSATPQSLIKAAILKQLTGLLPDWTPADSQVNLFADLDHLNADDFSLTKLLTDLSEKTGRDYSWVDRYQGRRIVIMSLFCLRNRSQDPCPVIFSALTEALQDGPGACICGRGSASAVFRRRSREVGNEIHRMLGLIRFEETSDGALVARPHLFHRTADLLLRKFQSRYPGRRLIFLLPGSALCFHQGRLFSIDLQDLPLSVLNQTDTFTALWEEYYRSQYIPERKNIRLASHFIPKKYWDWLPEGKILAQEAKK